MASLAFVGARSGYDWLFGALALIAALPRFLTYEIGFLLVGVARRPSATEPAEQTPQTDPGTGLEPRQRGASDRRG